MTPINDPVVLDIEQVPGATIETIELPNELPNDIPAENTNDTPAPLPEVPPAPVAEEKRYEYQPTDADGRPMGGKQVIVYRTPDELAHKLSEQSTHLLRKLREVTRKNTLGIFDEDGVAPAETRYSGPQEFKPRSLSPEERAQLAQDILDPERFDQAVTTVFEAGVGTSPQGLASKLSQLEADNQNIKALRESDRFMAANPGYVKCAENGEAISAWVARKGYAPTAENFQKAYDTLLAQDVLVTSLEVVPQREYIPEPPPPPEPVVPEPVVPEPVRPVSRVPSGLNRNSSSDAGTPAPIGDDITYEYIQRDAKGNQVGQPRIFKGLKAIDAMPPEEYRHRILHVKGFAAKVDKLYAKKA